MPENDNDGKYSDCEFGMAVNKHTGFIAVVCSRHANENRRLGDVCVRRLLVVMNDPGSPWASMLLRARSKESSHVSFEEIDLRKNGET